MNIEEKAEKLSDYCEKYQSCSFCELKQYICGCGVSWKRRGCIISDKDVEEAYNIVFGKEKNKMNKEFTKNDLQTGMVVETKDGTKYVVMRNSCMPAPDSDFIVNRNGWNTLNNYSDNLLENHYYSDLDIIKVYKPKYPNVIRTFEDDELKLIWQRKDYKEMTVAEIEEKLGYKIKIIEG